MSIMSGTFIILEGGEGAGKTTLVSGLRDALVREGRMVTTTREPGGTPWGERIRSLLMQKQDDIDHRMSPRAELAGYYMARFENLERVIIPALEEGNVVISDRFEFSGYAYQVHARSNDELEPLFLDLHRHVVDVLKPYTCMYLLCDVDPRVGLDRVMRRGKELSHFDAEDILFHEKVRAGMQRARFCVDPHFSCVTIDASKTPEEMLADALEHIHATL
jgi:dTMP kinase